MTHVTMIQSANGAGTKPDRALSGQVQAAGVALDALAAQVDRTENETFVIVRNLKGDSYFTEGQRARLEKLLDKRRQNQNDEAGWSPEDEVESQGIVDLELQAATLRAEAITDSMKRSSVSDCFCINP